MTNRDLPEIIQQARKGSAEAYDLLIERFSPKLFGYFVRAVGDRAQAEDLLQEVFVRLVRNLGKYRENQRFEVWLFRMARNLVIDHWRKRKPVRMADASARQQSDERIVEAIDLLASSERDPIDALEFKEQSDRLQEALQQLSDEQRETILLRYFGGITFEQIAQMTGCPIGTALARAHRGLAKLKTVLQE